MVAEDKKSDLADSNSNKKFLFSLMKGVRKIFILWLISREKIHGYAIISEINEAAATIPGDKVVHSSTIYPILHSLEKDDLIKVQKNLMERKRLKCMK